MRAAHVTAPSGVRWTVRAFRIRLPPWRELSTGQGLPPDDAVSVVFDVVQSLFAAFLVPLVIAILELPVAVVRGLASKDMWVEAATDFPTEERYLWRTTREDAATVHAAVAAQLSTGEPLRPARADLVEHTGT